MKATIIDLSGEDIFSSILEGLSQRSLFSFKTGRLWTVRTYRKTYKLFMANGVLFNQESEVCEAEFVIRKISRSVARIYHGSKESIVLGKLPAAKEWGYVKDYVDGIWMKPQQNYQLS